VTLRLYDATIDDLRPIDVRPRMSIYVCGITPYDSSHLGHAFTYVQFDVLVRHLRHLGAEVAHAQNVTDVDDDMLRVAGERRIDFRTLAEREVASFERSMAAIGVTRPTYSPRATEFVPQMIEEVDALIEAGHGYERSGTVYFDVSSDPGYGRLSRCTREEMLPLAAERGGHPEDPNKDDPLDFVLWQAWREGEPWWDSPWGRGRPGWHIECSTMSRRLLGEPVDIHGGGSDLVFPHHESELAQAEGVPGPRPFVRHWVHTGAVHMEGDKMSKSLGNLAFVDDLLERHEPMDLRAFLLRHHYREDWSFEEVEGPQVGRLDPEARPPQPPWEGSADDLRRTFYDALDQDLNTPLALRLLDRAEASTDPAIRDVGREGMALLGLDL
jgi:L-cysteine:1D-myo-inositol 2-amino-2-deoxy-alpha-D-glucopyranoside ligase